MLINQKRVIVKYVSKACNSTDEILALSYDKRGKPVLYKPYHRPSFTCSFAFCAPRVQLTALGVFPLSETPYFVYSASKVHAKPGRE